MNRRDFLRLGGAAAAFSMASGKLDAQTTPSGPGAIRFAVIGDFGETLADQAFPLDSVAAMIRSWNPDFVVSCGDNNYVMGLADTIDVNIGKNFTGFIYPKTNQIPIQYPYPPGSPLYNRFIPCLGNHDYGDPENNKPPTTDNIALSVPYLDYFRNALRVGLPSAPNTTVRFEDGVVGQSYGRSLISRDIENYAPFSETENNRFYDVRLGTPSGASSVHLFIFDSNPTTPYGQHATTQPLKNGNGSNSAYTEYARQGEWLQQRLAASTARWKIVIFHDPPYNSSSGGATNQYPYARWPFQAWGATAVITGHIHNYERLEMPDADSNLEPVYGGPTIPYFVNGAGGFIPEQGFDPSFVIQGSKVRVSEYGAMLVTADENSINFLYFDIDGVLRDVKTIYANPQTGAPQVEFSGREFPVNASAGSVQVKVTRLGNATAPLTVSYTTMDGTALAGTNYQAASGVLHFAANEVEKTIPVTIYPPPTFIAGTTPWESLIFNVALSAPTGGSIGFFSVACVIMVNTVDTPITNQDLFIVQTYNDIFQTTPTPAEIAAAKSAIGVLDLWIERARWVLSLMNANYATEPVFPAALTYAGLILSDTAVVEGQAVPPSSSDLTDGITLYRGAANPEAALIAMSEAFNMSILEALDAKVPGFATDNTLFVQTIYLVLVQLSTGGFSASALSTAALQSDLDYWLPLLSNASPAERSRTRNLMIGRMCTQSFNPPPLAGMTAFDLTSSNKNEVLLGIALAALVREQLTYPEFLKGFLIPARFGGQVVMLDLIYNLLISPQYAARFRVTSYEGYIDSVKGGLSSIQRLPGADPEGDGKTNLQEYSFALNARDALTVPLTEVQIEDAAGGQTFAVFSYRQARNIKRVEFLIQTSSDLKTWTAVSSPISAGGVDMGNYIKRRVKIPVPSGSKRLFFRLTIRPKS